MTELMSLGADVTWPDHQAGAEAARSLAAARGALGRLDELTEWLAGVQGSNPPHDFQRMRAALFATADPSSSVVAAADMVGVGLRAVAPVTGSVDEALAAGVALADDEVDSGTDLLVVACPGQGSAAAVLVSVLADTEPVKVLPRGTHIDPEDWMAMAIAVRDARRRAAPVRHRPAEVLEAVGSPDLAAAAGCLLRAAVRRTPVLLDGAGALAAAVVAYEAQPRAVRWWRAADRSPHNAHRIAVTKLGLSPVLDLDTWAEDGTAGLLAVPLLRAAARALAPSADV